MLPLGQKMVVFAVDQPWTTPLNQIKPCFQVKIFGKKWKSHHKISQLLERNMHRLYTVKAYKVSMRWTIFTIKESKFMYISICCGYNYQQHDLGIIMSMSKCISILHQIRQRIYLSTSLILNKSLFFHFPFLEFVLFYIQY